MTEDHAGKRTELAGNFEIRRASETDLPTVWGIVDVCAKWLSEKELNHWAKYYTQEMVAKMIRMKEVYLGFKNGEPIATATFDTRPPKYYAEPGYADCFTHPDESAVYVTALAVLPKEQKQGYAGQLLQFVEDEARKKGVKWLRLDCRAEVPGLVSFYEKRGFEKLGDKPVDEGEDGTYWLMEKSL